jgi:solute carrier family 39 (zinc transporter), member 1/2/3
MANRSSTCRETMGKQLAAALCLLLAAVSLLLGLVSVECECSEDAAGRDKARALRLKIVAIFCILAGGAVGAAVPSLGGRLPALRPDTDLFRAIKAFAGGVILAAGLVHILPAAFHALGSPCLAGVGPWRRFPFAGTAAMLSAIATLIVDTVATGYFRRKVARKSAAVVDEPSTEDGHHGAGDLEEAASDDSHHGHAHGMSVLAPATTSCATASSLR